MILSKEQKDVLRLMGNGFTLKVVSVGNNPKPTFYLESEKGQGMMLKYNIVNGLRLLRLIKARYDAGVYTFTDKGQVVYNGLKSMKEK